MELTLPLDAFHWVMAFLPIAIIMLLMIAFRWGAVQAGPVGWLIALAIGLTVFRAGWEIIAYETVKGTWTGVFILYIIWPAILIYEVTREANAFDPFRRAIERIAPNQLLQVLMFGWVFASFLQSITGFGVPVAVAAPLLVGIGIRPLYAVIIPLICHAWANTFGTLAVAWLALKAVTGMEGPLAATTALYAASFLWLLNFTAAITVCWIFGRGRGVREGLPAVLILSGIMGGLQLALSQWSDVLNAFTASCIALAVAIFVLGRTPWYKKPSTTETKIFVEESRRVVETGEKKKGEKREMSGLESFVPYFALIVVTFGVQLIPGLKSWAGAFKIGLPFPETITGYSFVTPALEAYHSFAVLTHPGTFLVIAALFGYFYFRQRGYIGKGGWGRVIINTTVKTLPASLAVIALTAMSKVMGGSGATDVLAYGTAAATGGVYPMLAPFIGMLGAFMTGSNMASNILFGNFQQITARVGGFNLSPILGSQTAGAAAGNMIAPNNVLLGTTTAGIVGREGEVLKVTLLVCFFVVIFIGIATLLTA